MNLQRHRNGSYSLTDLTRADIENLAFAAGTAETWYILEGDKHHGANSTFVATRTGLFSRLAIYLRRVSETRSPVKITLNSDRFDASLPAYEQQVTA